MKIGIIICTHSDFASGIKGAAEMIAGNQNEVSAVDFHNDDSVDDLQYKFAQITMRYHEQGIPCLYLVDMYGATPFNAALGFAAAHPAKIVCGLSLPLLLEVLLGAQNIESDNGEIPDSFLELCVNNANNSVKVINSRKIFE